MIKNRIKSSRLDEIRCIIFREMNIFRLVGDLSHLLAIIVLLVKMWTTRSCAGMLLDHTSAVCPRPPVKCGRGDSGGSMNFELLCRLTLRLTLTPTSGDTPLQVAHCKHPSKEGYRLLSAIRPGPPSGSHPLM